MFGFSMSIQSWLCSVIYCGKNKLFSFGENSIDLPFVSLLALPLQPDIFSQCQRILQFEMESLSNTPVLILRQNNRCFKARKKQLDHRVRNRKLLKAEIYSNHNIFHSNINLSRNMAAQDIIWDKNYNFKCIINQAKQENSSLKARIWNMEKENRRMERQIEAWNLTSYIRSNSHKKPYIDTATVETVISDQDYQIVSLKMSIFDQQRQFQQKEAQLNQIVERNKDIANITRLLNHEIVLKKVEIYECVEKKENNQRNFQRAKKEKYSQEMLKQNKQFDLVTKNIEIKKKSKIHIQNQLALVLAEIEDHKEVNEAEIQRLKTETKKMRTQEDGGIKLAKQQLKIAQQQTLQFQCQIQILMNEFIQTKIPIQLQIETLLQTLSGYQTVSPFSLSLQ